MSVQREDMGQYICEVNGQTAEVELNVLGKHHEWMDGLYTSYMSGYHREYFC